MKRFATSLILLSLSASAAIAQDVNPTIDLRQKGLSSHKECKVIVYENPQAPLVVRKNKADGSKGFGTELWQAVRTKYVSTATGLVGEMSADVISATVDILTEAFRSKKEDWRKMVKQDCTYEMEIPMNESVKDFYGANSYRGAMDPDSIIFDGFGCNQVMILTQQVGDSTINREIPIIDVKCSLRKDSVGLARMLHHGKFEVVLDYVKINPYLCNLPNIVLSQGELDAAIPFDFARRNNFKLSLNADIKSSWINEAILLNQNETLGKFKIDITIPDSTYLQQDGNGLGYFVYERPGYSDRQLTEAEEAYNARVAKKIRVNGESFLVPRTFIGYDENNNYRSIWGTGMYSVEMTLRETCDINLDYYVDTTPRRSTSSRRNQSSNKQHWNKHWRQEWNVMRHRQHKESPYKEVWQNVKMQYGDRRWVNTVISPATNFMLEYENDIVKDNLTKWLKFGKE